MNDKQIFISYSSKDQKVAYNICSILEEANLSCWIAPRDIIGGKSYGREILEAIFKAQVVLFIFSESSNKSKHVENEIDNAFNAEKTIIPFKIDQTKISLEIQYYLNKTHWVNGDPLSENAIENLKNAIKANLKAETTIPKEANKLPKNDIPTETEIEEELEYNIIQNGSGEILFLIKYREKQPQNPYLVYDYEENTLILYRNDMSIIKFIEPNTSAREPLTKVKEVLIVELEGDNIQREYMASMYLI